MHSTREEKEQLVGGRVIFTLEDIDAAGKNKAPDMGIAELDILVGVLTCAGKIQNFESK